MKIGVFEAGLFLSCVGGAMAAEPGKAPPVRIILEDDPRYAKPAAPAKPGSPMAPAKGAAKGTAKDASKDASKSAPAKKEEPKNEDEAGKIEGVEVARGTGFFGLQVVEGKFKLSFYNAKKKAIAPEAVRAALRWQPLYQKTPERFLLTVNGKVLTSERVVRPPYSFKLFITLFRGEGDEDVENYTVEFAQ
ncbi:MAG: hypothetical protein RLZZ15_2880 [Verrucomicrobiota bacterium]|jgi:hypothetical protein